MQLVSETTSKPIPNQIKSKSCKKITEEFNIMNSRHHQCVTFGQTIETISVARKQRRVCVCFFIRWFSENSPYEWQAQQGADIDIAHKPFTQNIYSGIKY